VVTEMAFLKVQRVRNRTGDAVCVSIVRSRRDPATGAKRCEFIQHVGTYAVPAAHIYGGFAISIGVDRACGRAGLTGREHAQVQRSLRRMLRRL
jgi:hypothetical protein